ncbi:restriction endonuclease subunit S [Alkalibacterium pelagium]|uniref:Type I restriction enzyme, S subunit n=1 Tax=Alkalibacterium pelagium TaxID=426702 RepID=A0A1H7JY27_9LACT|nr:restriction endonuclease subunit S [Alkalibacterium pelagium]GEN50519.1 restriction modification system DNA specificity domain-containing protein [Alkalibacterium pelagium]SEK79020.1 type I restriction enzyme, S subunit [Alkalibacterium pelagium]
MANREMKDSGVEWIGEMPEKWRLGKVKNAFIRKKEKADINNPTVLSLARRGIKVRNIDNNEGQLAADYSNYNPVNKGDILLNPMDLVSGANCNISYINGVISPAYINLKNLENYYSNYYIYYFKLQYWSNAFFAHGKGVSYENRWTLNNETIMNYPIPVPSIEEQQKIAAFLDEKVAHIDNIIEDTKQSIENLKAYRQSLITETVTKGLDPDVEMKDSGIDWIGVVPQHWISSRIKYVTKISRGQFSHRPRNDERFYNGQYPFIQTGDVARAKKYITSYSQTLNELGKKVSKEFPKGTLVMNIAANVGDVAILDFDSYFPDSVVGFVPIEEYNWNYLYYTFSGMKATFVRTAISNTQLNLNVDRIKDMYIPIAPDYSEQLQIADFLDNKISNIDSLIKKKSEIITELESYKKSLIYEYVTGKKEVK